MELFAEKPGIVPDEKEERFHQDIASLEQQYQGFWNTRMLADYCCILYRDELEEKPPKKFQISSCISCRYIID